MTAPLTGPGFRAARIAKGVSQSALARALGIHQAYVSQIELGERQASAAQLRRLYDALAVAHPTNGSMVHTASTRRPPGQGGLGPPKPTRQATPCDCGLRIAGGQLDHHRKHCQPYLDANAARLGVSHVRKALQAAANQMLHAAQALHNEADRVAQIETGVDRKNV